MKKIEMEEIEVQCDCQEDCIISRYTLSLKDKNIVERVSTRVWANKTGAPIYYRLGTDELDGNDFTGSHWYNMGKIPFLVCTFKHLLLSRGVLERFRWNNYSSRSLADAQGSYPYCRERCLWRHLAKLRVYLGLHNDTFRKRLLVHI